VLSRNVCGSLLGIAFEAEQEPLTIKGPTSFFFLDQLPGVHVLLNKKREGDRDEI